MGTVDLTSLFAEWYASNTRAPIKDDFAYGRRFAPDRQPDIHGANAARKLHRGTLVLWPDALVFLHKSVGLGWWLVFISIFIGIIVASVIIELRTDRTPTFLNIGGTLLLMGLITGVYMQKLDITSARQVLAAGANPRSLFIPVNRIKAVSHEYKEGVLLRPSLELLIVRYEDDDGEEAVALFGRPVGRSYGPVKFDAGTWAGLVEEQAATPLSPPGSPPPLTRSSPPPLRGSDTTGGA